MQALSKVIPTIRYNKATQGGTLLPLMLVQKALEEKPAPQEIHETDVDQINNQTILLDQLD
jgi:hypothetical protein